MIVGDGPKRADVGAACARARARGRVTFTGEVPDAELRALMHACAVLVLPSVTRAEAFGYVQLEAMACGQAGRQHDVPSGVSWVNQHERTGLVVPRRRRGGARARRSTALMADAALRARLGAAGRARVESEFTLGRLRERLRLLYEELALLAAWPAAC